MAKSGQGGRRKVRYKILVLDDKTMQSVRELRARGLSPPEIARSLGMRPATVADLVRKLAAERDAAGLGFAPHPDFEDARAHLGTWAAPSAITFGCNGKPTYVEGPYDNPGDVVRTLRRAVGRDGFHCTVALDVDELRKTG